MSEEEQKEILNKMSQEEFIYALALAKEVRRLQLENEKLKITIDFLLGKKTVEKEKNAKEIKIPSLCNDRIILNQIKMLIKKEINKRKYANVLDPVQADDYYLKLALEATLNKIIELERKHING